MVGGDSLRRTALWFYGVLVALAIQSVLQPVIPSLIAVLGLQPPDDIEAFVRQLIRVAVFGLTIVRFYLGAIVFFTEAYGDTQSEGARSEWGADFLFGLIHFIFFMIWGASASIDAKIAGHVFPLLLGIVLLYDVAWSWFCRGFHARARVLMWMWWNLATVVLGGLLYATLIGRFGLGVAEVALFLVVVLMSIPDFVGLTTGRLTLAHLAVRVVPRDWLKEVLESEAAGRRP
jgi:hypothetical protein